jgi:hypothetical protein
MSNVVDFPGADREVSEREVNDLHAEAFRDLEGRISDCAVMAHIAIGLVSIRHRPQVAYLSPSRWLSGVWSLRILMRSTRFSIPKSVKAITPSSPKP